MLDVSGNAMITLKFQFFFILIASSLISCISTTDYTEDGDALHKYDISLLDTSLNGFYSGLEYDRITTDPAYPGKKFTAFHIGYLRIKSDSIFLDQMPIFVYNKDTSYSVSDGGFFYWRGTKNKNDTAVLINLTEYYCDYCGILVRTNAEGKEEFYPRTKQLIARLTSEGLLIKGYIYRKMLNTDTLISERPKPKWASHY